MVSSFSDLPIVEPILSVLRSEGYDIPTPIQAQAIPPLLEGKDLLGCAQTGTGKTAAFAIPILQHLHQKYRKPINGSPRALVLVPTRELAVQVHESFGTYGRGLKLKHSVVFGGVGQFKQVQSLDRGVHILVATPGRLLDLMDQGYIKLDLVDHLVLDEADRMLDMGFLPVIKKILNHVTGERQSIFLSATMPPPIQELANELLNDPVSVMVAPPFTTAQKVKQRLMFVPQDKKRLLLEHILKDERLTKVLVFTRTKHGAERLTKYLSNAKLAIAAIHGNKSQNARQRVLNEFRTGKLRVLVATDVAARGIDVDGITHVINFEIPNEPDGYVHRIGRTARAGESGESISFCDVEELSYIDSIEREIGKSIPIDRDQPFHVDYSSSHKSTRSGKPTKNSRQSSSRPASQVSAKRFSNRPMKGKPHAPNKTHSRRDAGEPPRRDTGDQPRKARSFDEQSTPAATRKRSISGKVRQSKPAKTKSYGFPFAKKSSKKKGRNRNT